VVSRKSHSAQDGERYAGVFVQMADPGTRPLLGADWQTFWRWHQELAR